VDTARVQCLLVLAVTLYTVAGAEGQATDVSKQPEWLRRERAYRAYIRGLRYGLLGFVLAMAFGLLGGADVVSVWIPTIGVLASFVLAVPSIVAGMVGWILVPDKNRANAHQWPLLRMIAHDIFKGMPR
jgi:hypothetical protein